MPSAIAAQQPRADLKIARDVGDRVRRLRRQRSLSIYALAELVPCSAATISRLETGQSAGVPLSTLWHVAVALDCEVSDLFPSTGNGPRRLIPLVDPEDLAALRRVATRIEQVQGART